MGCCSKMVCICVSLMFLMFEQMHYDNAYGAYFDFGNHTEKVCPLHVIICKPFSSLWCFTGIYCTLYMASFLFSLISWYKVLCRLPKSKWWLDSGTKDFLSKSAHVMIGFYKFYVVYWRFAPASNVHYINLSWWDSLFTFLYLHYYVCLLILCIDSIILGSSEMERNNGRTQLSNSRVFTRSIRKPQAETGSPYWLC